MRGDPELIVRYVEECLDNLDEYRSGDESGEVQIISKHQCECVATDKVCTLFACA